MTRLQFLLKKGRPTPVTPSMSVVPFSQANNTIQSINPYYFLSQLRPIIQHGVQERSTANPRSATTEVALTAYLMGLGFDCRTAQVIVQSWKEDEVFSSEEIFPKNQMLNQAVVEESPQAVE